MVLIYQRLNKHNFDEWSKHITEKMNNKINERVDGCTDRRMNEWINTQSNQLIEKYPIQTVRAPHFPTSSTAGLWLVLSHEKIYPTFVQGNPYFPPRLKGVWKRGGQG